MSLLHDRHLFLKAICIAAANKCPAETLFPPNYFALSGLLMFLGFAYFGVWLLTKCLNWLFRK